MTHTAQSVFSTWCTIAFPASVEVGVMSDTMSSRYHITDSRGQKSLVCQQSCHAILVGNMHGWVSIANSSLWFVVGKKPKVPESSIFNKCSIISHPETFIPPFIRRTQCTEHSVHVSSFSFSHGDDHHCFYFYHLFSSWLEQVLVGIIMVAFQEQSAIETFTAPFIDYLSLNGLTGGSTFNVIDERLDYTFRGNAKCSPSSVGLREDLMLQWLTITPWGRKWYCETGRAGYDWLAC